MESKKLSKSLIVDPDTQEDQPEPKSATVTLLRISHHPRNGVLTTRRQDTQEIVFLPESLIPDSAIVDGQVSKSFHIEESTISKLKGA